MNMYDATTSTTDNIADNRTRLSAPSSGVLFKMTTFTFFVHHNRKFKTIILQNRNKITEIN